jgi:acyl transferase domain-containing protein
VHSATDVVHFVITNHATMCKHVSNTMHKQCKKQQMFQNQCKTMRHIKSHATMCQKQCKTAQTTHLTNGSITMCTTIPVSGS